MNTQLFYHLGRSSLNTVICLVFLFCGSACKPSITGEPTLVPELDASLIPSPAVTDTLTPSPSAQPSLVVLLAQEGSDTEDVIALQSILAELAAQDGLRFETRTDLATMEMDSDVRLAVVVPPDPGVLNLAAANPKTQFLAVGIPGLQSSRNLSVIGSGGDRPDQQGFLAGYLAAAITQDWRVGVITPSDTLEGKASRNGFGNGVIFYCGLCRPAYPPFFQYPVFVELPAKASQVDQQAGVSWLAENAVRTVYVFPGAGDGTLLVELAQKGVNIVGGFTPSGQVEDHWVASIRVDKIGAIRQIWTSLIRGEEGINLEVPLVITDQNINLFSLGRQRLVEKILAEMLAGYIDTGVDPATGELR